MPCSPRAAQRCARLDSRSRSRRRPGSPLPFFHPEGSQGPRYRLLCRGDDYEVQGSGAKISRSELLALLEREPQRFSSSALLRPLIQDSLLPTAVYVGGPAEVRYLAQLPPLYQELGIAQPLVAERAHFTLLTTPLRRLLEKLGIAASDLALPRAALLHKLSSTTSSQPAIANAQPGVAWSAELEARLDALAGAADAEPGVIKFAARLRKSVRGALERLGQRQARSQLARDSLLSQRLARLDAWLRPDGELQERVHSFPAFAARVGLQELRGALFAAIDPFHPELRELSL